MSNRIHNALEELLSASREAYGNNIVVDIRFDIVLGPNSRTDLSNKTISDILGKDEPNGNK